MKALYLNPSRSSILTFLIIAGFFHSDIVYGQEKFYFRNGSSFSYKLVEANDKEVKFVELKGNNPVVRGIDRENVVVAFNAQGLYLVINELSRDPEVSRTSLEKFYSSPGPARDVMIKSTPVDAIEGMIAMEDEAVNYLTPDGKPASLNMKDLIAIIYHNGEHKLLRDVGEVENLLTAASNKVQKIAKSSILKNTSVTVTKPTDIVINTEKSRKPELTEEEYREYRDRSASQVTQFGDFLQVIANKEFTMNERDQAIKSALQLFVPNTQIEVSSRNRKGVTKLPLEVYLKRLKMLPYGNVQIKWSQIEYVSELKQENDGNYYGTIVGSQTFTGYSEQGNNVLYSDVTKKSVKVKLDSYQKQVDGENVRGWNVLLGNIGVESNDN
jgi:hypothetical protein